MRSVPAHPFLSTQEVQSKRVMNSRRLQAEIETHGSGALLPLTQMTSLATPYDAIHD